MSAFGPLKRQIRYCSTMKLMKPTERTDGQGLDCDHASSNSVIQCSSGRNNKGGFCAHYGRLSPYRSNGPITSSQNDRDKTFEFAQGLPKGTMIYNNTIYSDTVLDRGVFYLSNTGAGQGVNDGFVFNNVFSFPRVRIPIGGDVGACFGAGTYEDL